VISEGKREGTKGKMGIKKKEEEWEVQHYGHAVTLGQEFKLFAILPC
jgi:hypothetical protein